MDKDYDIKIESRGYIRALHMFKMSYHMVQLVIMKKADENPGQWFDEIDLVDYMISVYEDLEILIDCYYSDTPDWSVFDDHAGHMSKKLDAVRGMIELEPCAGRGIALWDKVTDTAVCVMKYYLK